MGMYNEGDSSSMQPPDILSSSSQGASECSMSSQELGAVWLADAASSSGCCLRLSDQAQPGSDCSQWNSSCSTSCSSSPSLQTDETQHVQPPHRHCGHSFHSRAISNSFLALLIYSLLLGAPIHAARIIEAPASDPQVYLDIQLAFIYLPDSIWCTVAVGACRALIVQPYMLKAVFQALRLLVCRHSSCLGTHP